MVDSGPRQTTRTQFADTAPGPGSDADGLGARVGDRIGRYVVTGEIGRGGMGRVVGATDPTLGRPVAIKVLHRGRASTRALEARLAREGQALARLSHPNVVEVYEAGKHGADLFIAMALIDGPTLRKWQTGRARDPAAILAMYIAAGRGLAAAHALGLVHRDFKADNVLIDPAGRPKVVDFGLARAGGDPNDSSGGAGRAGVRTATGQSLLDTMLTERGTVMGTPPYIPPEVWNGGTTDARSDQFAWCVSLFEALFGELPYPVAKLQKLPAVGPRGPAPRHPGRVDGRTIAAIRRGLAPDPAARFPTMDALLAELSATRGIGGRRAVAVVGLAAASLAFVLWRGPEGDCPSPEDLAQRVWSTAQRDAAAQRVGATSPALEQMDEAVGAWAEAQHAACLAEREPTGDDDVADDDAASRQLARLAVACLDESRARLDAAARWMGTRATQDNASAIVAQARDIARCADASRLTARPEPPPAIAAKVGTVRSELAALLLEIRAGSPDLTARTSDALQRARATAFAPVVAEAQQVHGSALIRSGDPAAGIRELAESYLAAEPMGYDSLAASGAVVLVAALAEASRLDEAEDWSRHARGAIERAGNEPKRLADLHSVVGALRQAQARYDEAATELQAAIDMAASLPEIDPVLLAGWHNNLGTLQGERGQTRLAVASLQEALRLREQTLGPDHAEVGESKVNIASMLTDLGEGEEALQLNREGGEILRAARGAGYAGESFVSANEGEILASLGRHAEATAALRRSVAESERSFGATHAETAAVRVALAGSLRRQEKLEEARPILARAIEDLSEALGHEHPEVGSAEREYGELLRDLGQLDAARVRLQRALAIAEATHGDESDDAATAAYLLGELAWKAGQSDDAIALLARAADSWRTLYGPDSEPHTRALAALGRAQLGAGAGSRFAR
jgi:tetratricopeptide (TPR) repeat protein